MSKRCSTPAACSFESHCKHRQVPLHDCSGHFWPNNTGEACDVYELHCDPVESKWGDLPDRMGALE